MDEQVIRKRLERLHTERDHARSVVNAYDGAIQECEYWLSYVTAPDVKDLFPGADVVENMSAEKS